MIQIIIFSKNTGHVRRTIDTGRYLLETSTEVERIANLQPGEDVTVHVKQGRAIDGTPLDNLIAWQEKVNAKRGRPPAGGRHVELDHRGVVVGIYNADARCGDKPASNIGVELVQHNQAQIGWKCRRGRWSPA